MKILRMTLKKKWFDMIKSGEKKEEYREEKDFWLSRLMNVEIVERNNRMPIKRYVDFKTFDAVEFKNGYGKNAPTILVEFKGIEVGYAKPEWSDNWQGDVFIIKLGEILKQ